MTKAKRRSKPTMVLDFDGVIHSYTSGWQGARNIPDPPVPGAIEFIIKSQEKWTVAILSSRSHQWGGRRAMRRWLHGVAEKHFVMMTGDELDHYALHFLGKTPSQWRKRYDNLNNIDRKMATEFIRRIKWPIFKPAAVVSIDDRAIRFTGKWPTSDQLWEKPWNKK